MNVIIQFIERLFRCRHRNTSRVFSDGEDFYVTCFECGTKLPYCWEEMKVKAA